jgi:MFS superfamily sulfate permease-like transporter
MSALSRWLPSVPLLAWGHSYNRETLTSDLVAALIVTIMLIPQSLACLAGRAAARGGVVCQRRPLAAVCGVGQ